MDLVRLSISKPVGVAVGVILVVMFGLIGLGAIPIQLAPNVDQPVITVTTGWPGRSPEEIVDRITKEQEEVLKNIENLKSMRSVTDDNNATITLEFYLGTNIDRARQDVSDALRRVRDYPQDVTEPVIVASEGAAENAVAWIMVELPPRVRAANPHFDLTILQDDFTREVTPYLERVSGVAEVAVIGGRPRQMQVLVDPVALASRGLSYEQLISALRTENRDVAAGSLAEGKRDFRIRVMGKFRSEDDVKQAVIAYQNGDPVRVGDIAEVVLGYDRPRGFVRSINGQAMALRVNRQIDANVMDLMAELRVRLDEVRRDVLPRLHPEMGPHLTIRQVYDETTYITSAISLVTQNLWIGGGIAALVLLIFLRSFIATGVIAVAIPISVVGTFLILLALGRTLNVISLAGIAFAVGMVVDNAIVVLENIDRRRGLGEGPKAAAHRGGREVFGAIIAATLTTVAVFIPVLTIEEEAGQLFRDISIAIVASVTLSLVVSITVIPAACALWLPEHRAPKSRFRGAFQTMFGLAPMCNRLIDRIGRAMLWTMTGWRGWTVRPLVIVVLTAASLIGAAALMPPLDYLPAGNRNLVFGGLLIPPGYSVEQNHAIADRLEAHVRPYLDIDAADREAVAALPPIPRRSINGAPIEPFEPTAIRNFFIGAFRGGMFMGVTSADDEVVLPIAQLATNAMNTIPDAFGGASQSSLFGRGVGGGNTVNVEISGPRLADVNAAAGMMLELAGARYGYGDVRPDPSNFNLEQPEWRIRLNETGSRLGLRPDSAGQIVRALIDGLFVDDYGHRGENIDLVLLPTGGRLDWKESLPNVPVATPAGVVVPLAAVAEVAPSPAPQSIQRIEELPSVTLRIKPPADQALETTMEDIREHIIAPAREAGLLDGGLFVRLEGTAAKLDEVRASLIGRPDFGAADAGWQKAVIGAGIGLAAIGFIGAGLSIVRAVRRRDGRIVYGAVGLALFGLVLGGVMFLFGSEPQLGSARLVWALAVTYLLMCALFESFLYPLVIMFTVPLAIVGGFAGLAIVHDWTMSTPVRAPQNLDVLTMLGFIILIGVVVNNAILIVHQALNFMRGWTDEHGDPEPALAPLDAIAASVRSRIRPIFMSATTSIGGMLPLVLFPGAGSELYRGLGSVVIGGLLVSTVFTLLLAPLLLSMVIEMRAGVTATLAPAMPQQAPAPISRPAPKPARELETV